MEQDLGNENFGNEELENNFKNEGLGNKYGIEGNHVLYLALFGVIPYLLKRGLKLGNIKVESFSDRLGKLLMSLPRVVMMILMALPEQYVMMTLEPNMPLFQRLLVSVAMYVIHFAWNGMVMKPEKSYNELVWIIGTAVYALKVLGVKQETVIALVAADSVMTLALRGL